MEFLIEELVENVTTRYKLFKFLSDILNFTAKYFFVQ